MITKVLSCFLHALSNNHRSFARLFATLHKQSTNKHAGTSKDGTKKIGQAKACPIYIFTQGVITQQP